MLQRAAALVTQFTGRGLFVYCAYLVLDGSMTLGTMMYVNSAVNNLFVPVVTLTQLAVQVSALLVVLQRISYTLDSPQEVPDDPAGADFPMPVRSGIRLRHVTFGWDQETFSRILAGKTAVIVSQRVSMAMRCQRIVVLDHGRILEQGTHDELLALGGYYAKLYAVQTG